MISFSDALDFALSFPDMERCPDGPAARVMTLGCMRSLLARMGNPQDGRTTVHITGSKGKGSTAHFIASILSAAGLKTALYTSPHLHSYTERIAVDRQALSPEAFMHGMAAIRELVEAEHASDTGPVSTFGVMTSLFFHVARSENVDCQVVEVGLGGTYDGTNVFAQKDLAVFTPISLEHTQILGACPREIAASKSGIITPGCLAILAPQKDAGVKAVIAERCRSVGAELVDVETTFAVHRISRNSTGQQFVVTGPSGSHEFEIAMLGQHQIDNATTAVAAAQALISRGITIDLEAIKSGLAAVSVPGRLEVLSRDPLVVADGAHNQESMHALTKAINDSFSFRRCIFVLGMNQDKDLIGMLRTARSVMDRLVCTRSRSQRAMPADTILGLAGSLGLNGYSTDSIPEALELALGLASPQDLVCVTGSLAVVGEARELLRSRLTTCI